jgi:16S rRNA (guanine527-N7)-methyltransferase
LTVSALAVAVPSPPLSAVGLFGDSLPLAVQYAELLAGDGCERGLIGPREVSRLWERHLLNCAFLGELVPEGSRLVDVGSGAGLPGLVLAIHRPDLRVTLIEPMLRRVTFLIEAIGRLGLGGRVGVIRGRAEEHDVRASAGNTPFVTARAVAPLDRLVGWCLPMLSADGKLLALKGASAQDEVAEHQAAIHRLGGSARIVRVGARSGVPSPVVVVTRRPNVRKKGSV